MKDAVSLATREKFLDRYIPEPNTGCWLWIGACTKEGYGRFYSRGSMQPAHRISYEMFVGSIPAGLHLDHLCRVHCCVNPDHLEPVTCRENLMRGETIVAANARKTHCPSGHPLSGKNLRIISSTGHRRCLKCDRETDKRVYAAKKRAASHA
jgi:hypothetical protein